VVCRQGGEEEVTVWWWGNAEMHGSGCAENRAGSVCSVQVCVCVSVAHVCVQCSVHVCACTKCVKQSPGGVAK